MQRIKIVELSDCSQFRQTLTARPPAIVHGTILLVIGLLIGGLVWSAFTKANLVVRASGRVRPLEKSTQLFAAFEPPLDGRVTASLIDEGATVRCGDVLLQLDTRELDNRFAQLQRTARTTEEELDRLRTLATLLSEQFDTAIGKAQAELVQAETEFTRNSLQRESEVRHAQAELDAARDHSQRCEKIAAARALPQSQVIEAQTRLRLADERLVQAQLPLSRDQVSIHRRALELVERDFAVRRAELDTRIVNKEGELEAAKRELANLQIQQSKARLVAPTDAIVVSGRVQPGDVVASGKPIAELAPQRGFRFEAIVPSSDVGLLQVGMPVQIKFDAYDYQKYGILAGTVQYISPDSKWSESSDRPRGAAYLVRIELHADEVVRGHLCGKVKLGLGGTAEIVTGRESILAILVKRIRSAISLG